MTVCNCLLHNLYNTAQNSSDSLPDYAENHHGSDDRGDGVLSTAITLRLTDQ